MAKLPALLEGMSCPRGHDHIDQLIVAELPVLVVGDCVLSGKLCKLKLILSFTDTSLPTT